MYPLYASLGGDQVSQSHLDQQLQHSNASKCSRGGTWHSSNQPRHTKQPRRTHPTSREMHASGALKARCMHLLAPKNARVLHGIHASGGDAYLLPSKSSATGGSTPMRTNAGGSILPKIDPGGSVLSEVNTGGLLPQQPTNMSGLHFKDPLRSEGAYQQDASRPRLTQFNMIPLHPRCLISGIN